MKAIFLLGSTGVGKSDIAVKLAKMIDGEIISSDSVQIFRGLDIGSGKVTKEDMQNVVHYGIDILEPDEEFSVFDFVQFTKEKIAEITSKNKVPIVVGGTGLYVKALVCGYDFGGAGKDKALREKLEEISKTKGKVALFEILKQKDPKEAEKIDKDNVVRLIRAIEIAENNGKKGQQQVEIDSLVIALTLEKEKLYEKINLRVDKMLENGLIEEVKSLKKFENCQSMRAIGYKEIISYLNGETDLKTAIELVKQHSRNYAKRQMTFLRGMKNVNFVDAQDKALALKNVYELAKNFL